MSTPWLQAQELQGRHVRLEPLGLAHVEGLRAAVSDGALHRLWYTSAPAPEDVEAYVAQALLEQAQGSSLPFAVRALASGEIVGTTRYCHVDARNQRLEIGYTWYAAAVQRTAVNTECKWLLLRHAFEQLDCIAVEFRTHWLNQRSRAAIARLGARQDGILRNHSRMPDGSLRDTVVFSIIASEWPAIRQHLLFIQEQR
ncbi:GNAT family N-acetyltransferase [Frateuria aurantia]